MDSPVVAPFQERYQTSTFLDIPTFLCIYIYICVCAILGSYIASYANRDVKGPIHHVQLYDNLPTNLEEPSLKETGRSAHIRLFVRLLTSNIGSLILHVQRVVIVLVDMFFLDSDFLILND